MSDTLSHSLLMDVYSTDMAKIGVDPSTLKKHLKTMFVYGQQLDGIIWIQSSKAMANCVFTILCVARHAMSCGYNMYYSTLIIYIYRYTRYT